jgi:hypothetical protein
MLFTFTPIGECSGTVGALQVHSHSVSLQVVCPRGSVVAKFAFELFAQIIADFTLALDWNDRVFIHVHCFDTFVPFPVTIETVVVAKGFLASFALKLTHVNTSYVILKNFLFGIRFFTDVTFPDFQRIFGEIKWSFFIGDEDLFARQLNVWLLNVFLHFGGDVAFFEALKIFRVGILEVAGGSFAASEVTLYVIGAPKGLGALRTVEFLEVNSFHVTGQN